ncbi:M61 family metallopeptidase [Granulicella mallensis]|uniref:Putative metalloprotease with PDZ domain n=1 Tax=Granulicella mallensis TaxID=940614 RepID=A0A7W8E8X8_9BACT|nr:M61 family metallopeptidase [Granulicella mallensis]MBB5063004.1 putative metalloprotease with PDZ domain [Granulicella mallensis]
MSLFRLVPLAALCGCAVVASAQTAPIALAVDLTDAPRKILHATETIPVQPGPMTLVYPKWIPGEHGPTGPIDNQAGFVITANGQPVKWERDKVDMYAYHITVPAGASNLDVKMDFLATAAAQGFSAGASTSANLALLSWNELLVYPDGAKASDVMITPSLKVPSGWNFGTALEATSKPQGNNIGFKTVSLEQLIDSPVLAGRWFREIPLAPEVSPKHFLDLAGDGPEDIDLSQEHIDQFSKLVRETGALYKSRHYASYHFLVTLSDQVSHFGLEHHQSSDDRVGEKTFVDDNQFIANGLLLPHEFTHSWNGKYRRPAGLATDNYQKPMEGDLLWVYEGLTEYLGDILAARCGIWAPSVYRDRLATVAGYLNDARPGRTWRDLQDTATMAQVLYSTGGSYDNFRRDTDYYDEGELLWLEIDLTIREKTNGKKNIDDFTAAFHGFGGNTGPKVVPYTFEDVVAGLNAVVPNDWAGFLHQRLDSNEFHAPEVAGIAALSGYKLTYTDKQNYWEQLTESQTGTVYAQFSLGLLVGGDGRVGDVIVGSLADKAGFGPGMHILAVNGRAFTGGLLHAAIKEATGKGPAIEFIVENTGYYKVIRLDYHDGEKYPQMERVSGTPARMDDILQPMTK